MNALLELVTVLALPLALGAATLHLCGLSLDGRRWSWLGFAAPLGLGMSGALAFLSLVLTSRVLVGLELVLLAALLWLARARRPRPVAFAAIVPERTVFSRALRIALASAAVLGALAFASWSFKYPSGGWDAWAFWNTKARVFAIGGETWTWVFSQLVDWWHPEYPVLLPGMVARGWLLAGTETAWVPALVAMVFTLGTLVLVFVALMELRGASSAALGTLLLLGAPMFVLHGASQYADTPLGFFMLLSVAALAFSDASPGAGRCLVLSGLSAGLAAFTKNEGILFFACLCVARSAVVLAQSGGREWWRQAREFARGAALPLALVVLLKVAYASRPVNSEFYARSDGARALVGHVSAQLARPERWDGFFESWWLHVTTFDEATVPVLFVLAGYALLAGLDPGRRRATTSTLLLLVVLYALGTSAVFLGWSTLEIREHMDALNRLLLQFLPTLVLGVLLASPGPFAAGWRRAGGASG